MCVLSGHGTFQCVLFGMDAPPHAIITYHEPSKKKKNNNNSSVKKR
jgi:hypothetical protein